MQLLQKITYVYLLCSLFVGRIVCNLLVFIAPIFRKKPIKDFLFLPYTHKDNSGTRARVQDYLPFFEKDGYTYDVHYICDAQYYTWVYYAPKKNKIREYLFYSHIFWSRLIWCFHSRNYRTVFYQRSLFPDFYDQRGTPLEKLMRAYNSDIIVDYFDADYVDNPQLIHAVIRECDTLTLVNDFLLNYFKNYHANLYLNDLSIDTERYIQKTNFDITQPVRIFWTGNIDNLLHVYQLLPILRRLHTKYPIRLVIVGRSKGEILDDFVEHHLWSEETFNDLITSSDIAVYPAFIVNDITLGKVAYKCLEYATCKVPMIASPYGLSSRFTESDVLIARTEEEWYNAFIELIENKERRVQLAENAYQKILNYHDTKATYRNFVKILTTRWT
jgi:glycosyltransferase involved in cell wall biosynthesis